MKYWYILIIIAILILATLVRLKTYSDDSVLTLADTWFFLRKTGEIVENNYQIPEWDSYSHFPPGRPNNKWWGWEYTMAGMHYIGNLFLDVSVIEIVNIAPIIMILFSIIIAYLLGNLLSNKFSGIMTAATVAFVPLILIISVAGYCDSDILVLFYSLLCICTLFYAFKKRNILSYILAISSNILFIISWIAGWYIIVVFSVFLIGLISISLFKKDRDRIKDLSKFLLIIFVPIFLITLLLGFNIFSLILERFFWFGGEMIVNISVAELQKFNFFSLSGITYFNSRFGFLFYLFFLVPIFFLYKIKQRITLTNEELFLLFLLFFTFFLLTTGTRFILLFSVPIIILTGYVMGKVWEILPKEEMLKILFYGIIGLFFIFSILGAYSEPLPGSPAENWFDAMNWLKENADEDTLVATWWDPGHFIAYHGFKNHADGAHCPDYECSEYDHNVRIRDMGRIFTTLDEEEAITLLKKYNKSNEVYLLASKDLILKYHWMYYFSFGSYESYIILPLSYYGEDMLVYGDEHIAILEREGKLIAALNFPLLKGKAAKEVIYYFRDQRRVDTYTGEDVANVSVWLEPEFRSIILMYPEIKDSLFTKFFFFSETKFDHFRLVYFNSDIYIYRVIW